MEDKTTGEVVGTAGIESAIGLDAPWYNYKVNKQVHASAQLGVYTMVETLMLCSDHTGCSELCTLFFVARISPLKKTALFFPEVV